MMVGMIIVNNSRHCYYDPANQKLRLERLSPSLRAIEDWNRFKTRKSALKHILCYLKHFRFFFFFHDFPLFLVPFKSNLKCLLALIQFLS